MPTSLKLDDADKYLEKYKLLELILAEIKFNKLTTILKKDLTFYACMNMEH
jgi:hypothetical protein